MRRPLQRMEWEVCSECGHKTMANQYDCVSGQATYWCSVCGTYWNVPLVVGDRLQCSGPAVKPKATNND